MCSWPLHNDAVSSFHSPLLPSPALRRDRNHDQGLCESGEAPMCPLLLSFCSAAEELDRAQARPLAHSTQLVSEHLSFICATLALAQGLTCVERSVGGEGEKEEKGGGAGGDSRAEGAEGREGGHRGRMGEAENRKHCAERA